jgi:hypothetical protein
VYNKVRYNAMNKLYTIGYVIWESREDIARVVAELGATLVDIRFNPQSRMTEWRRYSLERYFGDRYVWEPGLGNVNYKNQGEVQFADWQAGAVHVAALLERGPVILMCGCAVLKQCHRLDAANRFRDELGCEVKHLFPPKKAKAPEPVNPQLDLFPEIR